jgi:AcrR family transcriptional regulator
MSASSPLKRLFQCQNARMEAAKASPRREELLEAAYRYVLDHGLGDLSLRPLAAAVGSSPRVLLYLFGSKDGLVRALLIRARADEQELLRRTPTGDLAEAAGLIWDWLSAPGHRAVLTLWVEAYARSLIEPDGPWAGFARDSVREWLALLASAQPPDERDTAAGTALRTSILAVLRGALLDLLATGDTARTTAAVRQRLAVLGAEPPLRRP